MLLKRANNLGNKKSELRDHMDIALAATGGMLAGMGSTLPVALPVQVKIKRDAKVPIEDLADVLNTRKEINDVIKLKNHMGFKGNIHAQDVSSPMFGFYDDKAMKFIDKLEEQKIFPRSRGSFFDDTREMYKRHGPAYIPDSTGKGFGDVVSPIKDKYILAHELGHGTGRNKLARTNLGGALRLIGMSTPISAVSVGASYDPSKKLKDQDPLTKANLALLGASSVGAASTLAEEARASIRGAKALKELNQGTYKEALKKLGPAYATYATTLALAPYVGYKVSRKIKDRLKNKDENNLKEK